MSSALDFAAAAVVTHIAAYLVTKLAGNTRATVVIGSRKSKLAMIQTHHVQAMLQKLHPENNYKLVNMETIGDKILSVALSKIGTKSLFTKELEAVLLDHQVDLVVHSLKDLPTTLPEGLALGAIMEREDPRDAVIFRKDKVKTMASLADLDDGSYVGTSSLRRVAQLSALYPKLKFESVRGNLNTRLAKLDGSTDDGDEGKRYSCLVLAAAGVIRMGWKDRITEYMNEFDCPYAVSQGALGIECRSEDKQTLQLLKSLHHAETAVRCCAERSFMRSLEGGCSVPIGVSTSYDRTSRKLSLRGAIHSLDGTESAKAMGYVVCQDEDQAEAKAVALGIDVAESAKVKGARRILDAIPRQLETPSTKPSK
eukprot:m.51026 g.51026  ORF g.51026 m.51026 type:complete len:368 (+) comp21382_c0_seq1:24-1127(+)